MIPYHENNGEWHVIYIELWKFLFYFCFNVILSIGCIWYWQPWNYRPQWARMNNNNNNIIGCCTVVVSSACLGSKVGWAADVWSFNRGCVRWIWREWRKGSVEYDNGDAGKNNEWLHIGQYKLWNKRWLIDYFKSSAESTSQVIFGVCQILNYFVHKPW